jgi:shikimate dehydrogenase
VYGLIGDPVDHSISPIIQNAAFRRTGLDAIYVTFQVKKRDLNAAVIGGLALGIRGFNVTIPHKIRITRYLDTLDQEASNIGSVNTVVNHKGSLKGFNTDSVGALKTVKNERLRGASVLLLGAGGAARAIGHAFAPEVKQMRIVNRTISNARELERALHRKYQCKVLSSSLSKRKMKEFVESADLIVNASSMGMKGKHDPPIRRGWLHPSHTVFDIVYDPPLTTLLRNARSAGAQRVDGLEMLLNQGAASFELWTGKSAPITEMRRALFHEMMMSHADS